MSAVVGTVYSELFTTGVTETFTLVSGSSRVNGSLVVWTPTVTQIGTEHHLLTYTPAQSGAHSCLISGTVSGELAVNFDVQTASQADPAAALAAQTVTVTSPLTAAGTLTIVSGDDYLNADGRAISWDVSGYPSLVGGTVTFTAIRAGTVRLTKAMTVVDLNTVRLELTDTDTGTLFVGRAYTYEVNALIGASNLLIASGSLVVT